MIDWTISLGNIITLIFAVASVVGFGFAVKYDVRAVTKALEVMGGRFINVENDIKEIERTLTVVARQDERIIALDVRVTRLEHLRESDARDRDK